MMSISFPLGFHFTTTAILFIIHCLDYKNTLSLTRLFSISMAYRRTDCRVNELQMLGRKNTACYVNLLLGEVVFVFKDVVFAFPPIAEVVVLVT
jgi:hypothetical protein